MNPQRNLSLIRLLIGIQFFVLLILFSENSRQVTLYDQYMIHEGSANLMICFFLTIFQILIEFYMKTKIKWM